MTRHREHLKVLLFSSLLVGGSAVADPVPATPPPPGEVPAAPPPVAEPIAGYNEGSFFLRDPKSWFVLYPKGRLQVDWYNFLNRGDAPLTNASDPNSHADPNSAADTRPKDQIFVRRARIELQGTFASHFDFSIAGEFGSVPATGAYGTLTDCFVNINYTPWANVQIGQYDAPFTLENRTSDKYFDFMERSLAVRALGVPSNKEDGAMVWGYAPNQLFYYSAGVFSGDGQSFKALDNQLAVIGRAFVAPFATVAGQRRWLKDVWVGGSVWWKRAVNLGGPVTPNNTGAAQNDVPAMTTQGGVGFFNSSYSIGKDMAGNAIRAHLTPDGDILKWAVEANLPWRKFGLRFEFVNVSMPLAYYVDSNPAGARLARTVPMLGGRLKGQAFYLEAWAWILGDSNYLESPGLESPPRVKPYVGARPFHWGLQIVAKYENLHLDVSGLPQDGGTDSMGNPISSAAQGGYQVHVGELGVNAWATKHIRVTANYIFNYFDGDARQITKNLYFHGSGEHELLFRIGANL